jgi:hypothetical protein
LKGTAGVALFALDQGFPLPIVEVLDDYIEEAALVHLPAIDPRLTVGLDDWQVLLALHHDERPWDGLITTDADMVSRPRELCAIMATKLTVVAAEAAGHDPLKATGLVLAHLPGICKRTRPDTPQVWVLRTAEKQHEDPWERLRKAAEHRSQPLDELYRQSRISPEELASNPLAT